MKKLLAVILMVIVLPCTGYALQVTVYSAGVGTSVNWTGPGAGSGFAGEINTSIGEVYCVELGQSVSPGGVYNYVEVTPTGNYVKAAWLVNQFGSSADTSTEAAALQAAIWEVIYDGGFNLTGPSAVLTQQLAYLSSVPSDPTLPPGYILLYNPTNQDLIITHVPEPGTLLLMGLGLVGLAGLRRKE